MGRFNFLYDMVRFHRCVIIFMAVMNIDLDDHNRASDAATNTTLKNDNAEDNNHDNNDSNDVTLMIPLTNNVFQARFCQSVTEMPHWTRWMPLVCCSHFT